MIAQNSSRKKMVLTLVNQTQNKTEIYKFKAKDDTSLYKFCLGSVSQDFTKDEQSEISLNGTVYDFSVRRRSFKKKAFLILTNI